MAQARPCQIAQSFGSKWLNCSDKGVPRVTLFFFLSKFEEPQQAEKELQQEEKKPVPEKEKPEEDSVNH